MAQEQQVSSAEYCNVPIVGECVSIITSEGSSSSFTYASKGMKNQKDGVTCGQSVALELFSSVDTVPHDSVLNSAPTMDVVCAGGVEELQNFLSSFNSELAAGCEESGGGAGDFCPTTTTADCSSNTTYDALVSAVSTMTYEDGSSPLTTVANTDLQIVEYTESAALSEGSMVGKELHSGQKRNSSGDQLFLSEHNPAQYQLQPNSGSTASEGLTASKELVPVSLSGHIDRHEESSQQRLVIQGQQFGALLQQQQQRQRPTQQLLIPVDCRNAMLNGNQIAPGSTVLLPVVPTMLPDGSIEVRITGQAIALPPSISVSGSGSSNAMPNAPVPVTAQQPSLPQQPSMFVVVGAGDGNSTAANKQSKKLAISRAARERKGEKGSGLKIAPKVASAVAGSKAVELSHVSETDDGKEAADGKSDASPGNSEAGEKKKSGAKPASKRTVFQCEFCDYSNVKKYLLVRHMKSHSEDRPHVCHVCEKRFKTANSLQNHVNTHTGVRPHHCQLCEASFTTSGEMVRHVRYKHTQEKPHKCPNCDYASVELSKLRRHMRSHTGERPYQCRRCEYASPDMYKLKRHMRVHTGEKPYECDICLQRFTQSNSLKAHKLIHSGSKPVYQCEFCSSSCGRKTDLKIHIQKLHTALDRPLSCKKCGKMFLDRYSLKLHQRTHEGERCHSCTVCNYSALTQRHLDAHMMVHRCEKPFACPFPNCMQAFRQKSQVKRHVESKHGDQCQSARGSTVAKNLQCKPCNRVFRNTASLRQHQERSQCLAWNASSTDGSPADKESLELSDGDEQLVLSRSVRSKHAMRFFESEDESDEDDTETTHQNNGRNRFYKCSSCGEYFRQLVQLEQHCQLEHIGAECAPESVVFVKRPSAFAHSIDRSPEVIVVSLDVDSDDKESNGIMDLPLKVVAKKGVRNISPRKRTTPRQNVKPAKRARKSMNSSNASPKDGQKTVARSGRATKRANEKTTVDLEEQRRKDVENCFGFSDLPASGDEPTSSAESPTRIYPVQICESAIRKSDDDEASNPSMQAS